MSARRFLAWFVAIFLALSAITVSLNLVVDPYLVFDSPRIKGSNQVKVAINDYVGTAKAFEPFRHNTDVLLAGNSRIEMGLDPDHDCFVKLGLDAYNLGIPGAAVGQQLNYILNVVYAQPVRRVYLSVDFLDFLVSDDTVPPQADPVVETDILPRRFDGSDNPVYAWTIAKTKFQALFSLNALTHSVTTLFLQGQDRPNRLDNGFNPARDFARATAAEGPGALFEQKMALLHVRLAPPMGIRYADGTLVREFELFSRFLDIAAVEGVEVIVLTNPFHEWFWDLVRERGLMDVYESWLDEIRHRVHSAAGTIGMWEFSGESEFIHEQVPRPGIGEPSHYRKNLGDKMLDSMLATECGSQANFGNQLVRD